MEQLRETDYALARLLLKRITSEKGTTEYGTISYGDCAKQLSQEMGRAINPHLGLTMPLYRVGGLCFDLGLPFLTALVTYQNDPKGTIGQGFYKMVCEYRPENKSLEPFSVWKSELARVREWRDWSALSEYLSRHS